MLIAVTLSACPTKISGGESKGVCVIRFSSVVGTANGGDYATPAIVIYRWRVNACSKGTPYGALTAQYGNPMASG